MLELRHWGKSTISGRIGGLIFNNTNPLNYILRQGPVSFSKAHGVFTIVMDMALADIEVDAAVDVGTEDEKSAASLA